MGRCVVCGVSSRLIATRLGLCAACVRAGRPGWADQARSAHGVSRRPFRLPEAPPSTPDGLLCRICANECLIGPGEVGYCGLRRAEASRIVGGEPERGAVDWYLDPLPTNCVADWVCPAGTGAGFPRFAYRDGPEYGYYNLAVFYRACSFDCLFCQNWHFRRDTGRRHSPEELAAAVTPRVACICYFGGDPTPQLPHALAASRLALRRNPDRILRICWESNGSMQPALLDEMIELSLRSGGCVKFDLKAWNESLHVALCGVSNQRTLENFARAARHVGKRPEPPLLIASTLLVPGYVDAEEVSAIARFIAGLDVSIPYALLAFAPQFEMSDLPCTPRSQAEECLAAARETGLKNVRLGNTHLIGL
ncbi:MAG: radical SAM protein [Armatimonadetes bacterium]|nr:radical SAM protein [Armatimonadota bacterium]